MLATDLYDLRKTLMQSGVMFAYSGYMTEQVRLAVGETLKQKLSMEEADTKTVRSVFAVFVEQMQNVIRYSAERVPEEETPEVTELSFGILTIGKEGNEYVLLSGNLIRSEDTERVSEKLREIQGMNHDQLKRFYKDKLREGPDEYSQGAGIGFIEIARRASRPIEFDFAKVDDRHSFFALKANI
ncbi:MAG: SiaB family protein kinase [Roseobacter sp.]|uniref:SiaB family protein kinase n=1 Tax=Tateyamaria sp. TaxID=1929288 RepID=UPI00327237F5